MLVGVLEEVEMRVMQVGRTIDRAVWLAKRGGECQKLDPEITRHSTPGSSNCAQLRFVADILFAQAQSCRKGTSTSGGLENRTVMSVGNTRRCRRRGQDARFSYQRDAVVLRDIDCRVL